jgi:hypothetical protein
MRGATQLTHFLIKRYEKTRNNRRKNYWIYRDQ